MGYPWWVNRWVVLDEAHYGSPSTIVYGIVPCPSRLACCCETIKWSATPNLFGQISLIRALGGHWECLPGPCKTGGQPFYASAALDYYLPTARMGSLGTTGHQCVSFPHPCICSLPLRALPLRAVSHEGRPLLFFLDSYLIWGLLFVFSHVKDLFFLKKRPAQLRWEVGGKFRCDAVCWSKKDKDRTRFLAM